MDNTHSARVKDLKALAARIKDTTDEFSERISALEELANTLLIVTSSIIDNIGIGGE